MKLGKYSWFEMILFYFGDRVVYPFVNLGFHILHTYFDKLSTQKTSIYN